MPASDFIDLLRIAVIQFALGSILVERAFFRDPDPRPRWRSVLRAIPHVLVPAVVAFGVWVVRAWSSARWDVLIGLEILLAFLLLELGLAALAKRFQRRAVFLALGWGYAAAVAIFAPGGPGETLLAVTLLGTATLFLGIRVPGTGAEP